ncbi:hypothetical protein MC885_003944 [Smutsia gigantea]|nr:hypothetical protein MC885_003944 [Smutsia gigantea]
MSGGPVVQAAFCHMALSYSCLVLTGPPSQHSALVDFVGAFTKNTSFMICGNVVSDPQATQESKNHVKWLNVQKVAGLGHLKPNLLVLGYKENWQEVPIPAVEDCVGILRDAFDHNYVSLHWQPRTLFCSKQGRWTVDVYWLSSDGGLMLLSPFLLTHKKNWAQCPNSKEQVSDKLYSNKQWEEEVNLEDCGGEGLPMIPRSACPGALCMAWLEMLSRGLTPPIAFIHGHQQDTLPLYHQ